MKKEELSNKTKEEKSKPSPKKIYDDNSFKKTIENSKNESKVVRRKTPNKIDVQNILNKMIKEKNSKIYNIIKEYNFFL